VAYQQSHSLVGVLDNDLSSEEDYEEVRDPPENEGTVARHGRSHEANRNCVGALDNDLSTEGEDDEEEIIDSSDEVMEEQGIQGTRGQALTGARDPLVGIHILTSQANADAGSVERLEVLRKPQNSLQTFDVVVKWHTCNNSDLCGGRNDPV
jgi:hypothetical protein